MHLLARIRQRSPTRRSRLEKFCYQLAAGRSVSSYLCTVRAPPGVTPSLLRTDINKHEALLSLFGVVSRLRHAKRKSPDFQCFTRQSPVFNSDVAASYAEHWVWMIFLTSEGATSSGTLTTPQYPSAPVVMPSPSSQCPLPTGIKRMCRCHPECNAVKWGI